jgi:hypothetical protein
VEIDTLDDIDKVMFIERGIRGGISQCMTRYSKANNKYMTNYNPEEPICYLQYLDQNNLYGMAMSQALPKSNLVWDAEASIENILELPDDAEIGYIVEADVHYPRHLHEYHKDLPFLPIRKDKLLTTLFDKKNYVVHYRNLKQAVKHGLVVTKLHRALKFNQSKWLKEYIDINTDMRTKATNSFDKDFYKLMNNSCFGKTMENIRKRVEIHLVIEEKKAKKLIAKPNFKRSVIFAVDLVSIEMNKTAINFNKPIHVGMSILDLSKIFMYEFHYDYIKPKYLDKVKIMYIDTDSYIYEFKGVEDIYQDMKENIHRYDTSDFPENNPYGIPLINKKVLGKMKDENNGKILTEWVGLRSKMYSKNVQGINETKKAKGVKKYVVENKLSLDDYRDVLFNSKRIYREMHCIRSKKHDISTVRQNKIALSYEDDKRIILEDGVNTVPHGYAALESSGS